MSLDYCCCCPYLGMKSNLSGSNYCVIRCHYLEDFTMFHEDMGEIKNPGTIYIFTSLTSCNS